MRDLVAEYVAQQRAAIDAGAPLCAVCGVVLAHEHDHKPDQSGLHDGPWLPGHAPRKRPDPKPPEEVRAIRLRAWKTRREKLGPCGHR